MRGLSLLAALVLGGCAPTPKEQPERQHPAIVSLNPCSDAVLIEVADPEQILAISHFSQSPASSSMDIAKARLYRATSGAFEEVMALKPDVVVADAFVPAATLNAYRDLGIPLVQLPIATSIAQSEAQIMQLARLAGHPERGEALVARIDAALARNAPPAGAAAVPALVWQSGGIVPGDGTLIADLLRRTGYASLSSMRGLGQADVLPLEAVLADPPRVIFAAGNPRSNEDRLLSHPALDALNETRRVRFDPSLLWCGGPTIIRASKRLAAVRGSL